MASSRAMLVFPVPGGPHRIIEARRPAATIRPIAPSGPVRCSWPTTSARVLGRRRSASGAFGAGLIEGWRGPVFVALEAGRDGAIHRCHPHDPSWQNWPAIEHAILGNLVADFPLINKSFNLAYSAVDL